MKTTLIFFLSMIITSSLSFAGGYEVGDKASDFTLKNVDGKMVSLADYKEAKGFIVIFTCNHCPYSKLYEDRIIVLDAIYKGKGFPVIAINPNDPAIQPEDSYPLMQERAREKGFTFPYLVDETKEVARAYGASRTPHVFILSKKEGDLIVKYIGAIDNNSKNAADASERYAEEALNALLNGDDPEVNYTKAVGCTIK